MTEQLATTQFWTSFAFILLALGAILTAVAYCIYFERKISAWIQDRYGPNRVGPLGLLQPLADGLKFVLKEDIIPARVDRILFLVAPALSMFIALLGFIVLPFGGPVHWPWMPEGTTVLAQGASIDIGLLYIVAVGSLSVYGVVVGGWASNNKYAFYGAMRAAAQMLSYEVPLGLALLTILLTAGSLRLENVVTAQIDSTWFVFVHPVTALLLFIAMLAETNRTPFDLAEAEQELVGGYHTEFSAMKFAMFFLGEYVHIITAGGFMAALFLGGWEPVPFSRELAGVRGLGWLHWITVSPSVIAMLLRIGVTGAKIAAFVFVVMWIRWTLPRFRFDQLMRLAWVRIVPLGMAIVAIQGLLVFAGRPVHWIMPVAEIGLVALAGWVGATLKSPVTGRQASMVDAELAARV